MAVGVEYFFVVSWGQILNDEIPAVQWERVLRDRCVRLASKLCLRHSRESTLTTRTQTHTHKRE